MWQCRPTGGGSPSPMQARVRAKRPATPSASSIARDGARVILLLCPATSTSRPREYERPTWLPDGSRVALVTFPRLAVARRNGTARRRIAPKRLSVSDPAWSPDGRWIAFVANLDGHAADVYLVRPDGTGLRQLTRTRSWERSPAWLPPCQSATPFVGASVSPRAAHALRGHLDAQNADIGCTKSRTQSRSPPVGGPVLESC
jgi:dipeptidyl aminopeptidase/acylaminoacyl peptidase